MAYVSSDSSVELQDVRVLSDSTSSDDNAHRRLALGGRRTGSEAAGGGVSSGGLSDGSGIEMGDLGETGGSRSRGAGRPLWGDGAGFIHEAEPSLYERCIGRNLNKGNVSNLITFSFMVLGLVIVLASDPGWPAAVRNTCPRPMVTAGNIFGQYVLAFGLFGFSGGITNWLAVKMLFDRVCGLPGSGVIPGRFKEIRNTIKNAIMETFFDPEFLEKYLQQKAGQLAADINFEAKIQALLESPEVDQVIDIKLAELGSRPEGIWLSMNANMDPAMLKPTIKPFILGMGADLAPLLLESFDPNKMMGIDKLRDEIDSLMSTKLQELTPARVKHLLESVIRSHLGWLVVWGNIFGGCIGILTKVAGY